VRRTALGGTPHQRRGQATVEAGAVAKPGSRLLPGHVVANLLIEPPQRRLSKCLTVRRAAGLRPLCDGALGFAVALAPASPPP
jgi:hypothetical protein